MSIVYAGILDIDHFVAAYSLSVYDATHLIARPYGHSLLFILAITFLLFLLKHLVSYFLSSSLLTSSLTSAKPTVNSMWSLLLLLIHVTPIATIYLLSSLSHIIRDSSRRGLWFFSSYKTSPIPYFSHLMLLCVLPYSIFCSTISLTIIKQRVIACFQKSLEFNLKDSLSYKLEV